MKFQLCIVTVTIIVFVFLAVQSPAAAVSGTCASIGYNTQCCPPGANCRATDGDCECGASCHNLGDCCADVHCPPNPTTCQDIGVRECCSATSGSNCNVFHRNANGSTNTCSCDVSCHANTNCCSDAETIGCFPRTCSEANKLPGCCTSSCFVRGGNCYCDSICSNLGDCCSDVPMQCAAALMSQTKQISNLQQELLNARAQRFGEYTHKLDKYNYRRRTPDFPMNKDNTYHN